MYIRDDNFDQKILHDEYFGKKPAALALVAVRLVLLCIMSASFILIFCDIYGYTGNKVLLASVAAYSSGIVYILASVFPSSVVYGGTLAAAAAVIWIFRLPSSIPGRMCV